MQPLVCFFEKDLYYYSTDYERIILQIHQLSQIEKDNFEKIKIIQTDFLGDQLSLFILNDYKIISSDQISNFLPGLGFSYTSNINQDEFKKKIKLVKEDITAGRYYQLNLTSSFDSAVPLEISSYDLFRHYFAQFQAPYSAFLPLVDSEILCFSPELFLEKEKNNIKTCPIKGSLQKNLNFESLLSDQKEDAELSMIVDLLRNDLQSVCHDPVAVDFHRKELKLNYITHTYSQIQGATHLQLPEILNSMLPAGSVSGCPKKESIKAIQELERSPRGFYTGCIGWWTQGDFKLNVAIRSFQRRKEKITYYSGCGIVFDSDPEKEWQEFNAKARHLRICPSE